MRKFLLLLAFIPSLLNAQHVISGGFTPAEDFTYAFLYHATPTGAEYIDRAELSQEGRFSIKLDSTKNPGIYKIVYALPAEENNFDFIYNGKESIDFNFSIENGLEFTNSNENKLWASYIKSMAMVNMTLSNFYTQQSNDQQAFMEIIKTMSDTQKAYEENSKGMITSSFVEANTPYIPKTYEDLSTYSKHLKQTYLKHVDFSNTLLQSSDFLVERVLAYIFGMSANTSNTVYKTDIDHLMTTMGEGNIHIKTILFEMIWQRFKEIDNAEIANYITDQYLLELTKQTGYEALKEQLIVFKNNTVGNKAANFDLTFTTNGKTISTNLHDLDIANQYLVIFWSSTCGHCLDELPKVKAFLEDKKDIQVIAFGMEDEDPKNWQNFIADYPDFIHVLGLGKWDNPTSNAYGISSTPSFFLLDKDKTILSKPYDVQALMDILK
ncbi:Thiol-disulfide isomerase or thioredoxin [Formosa sp. Hel1_31_208]|uniref:TlpA family protein disulfide reductase n=1 Tax=Formosa sp. Hel1_31_208 TaxID=1798225 RepID=UPI00087C0918|nr:TlpA disulfide reductase family protein [Formosa sp. Hel1_31_208]SDR69513.1 Thiol-disulfide isomerase or thioredoxin [Formosa sp. Hel1_31_208]